MNFGIGERISVLLKENFLEISFEAVLDVPQPFFFLGKEDLLEVCKFLNESDGLYFDFLNCITCIDNGPEAGTMHLVYTLSSIPLGHSVNLRVEVGREANNVPSLTAIWKSADWHEREIFDFFGLGFVGHPDLRRILLPADWEGHPLRKDYVEQEKYHGMIVKYQE